MEKAMKISSQQVRAALAAYVSGRAKHAAATTSGRSVDGSPDTVHGLEDQLATLPDERDTIVHELRRKIRRGRYFVSSRDIVNALLGRLAADLLNED